MQLGTDARSVKSLSRHTLEQLVTLSSEGILVADARDPNLAIIYANPAYEGLTGYSVKELKGAGWPLMARTGDDASPELERLKAAIGRSESCQVTLPDLRKDGTPWFSEVSVEPLYTARGEVKFYLCRQKPAEVVSDEPASLGSAERESTDPVSADSLPMDTASMDSAATSPVSTTAPATVDGSTHSHSGRPDSTSADSTPDVPTDSHAAAPDSNADVATADASTGLDATSAEATSRVAAGANGAARTPPVEVTYLQRELGRARQKIASLNRVDPATGLLRFEHFLEFLRRDIAIARREKRFVTLLCFDIVEFDAYRRTFGSKAADSCQRMIGVQVARVLRRASDLSARYDDSALVSSALGQQPHEVSHLADVIADNVRKLGLHNPRAKLGRHLTVRTALVPCPPGAPNDVEQLYARALRELRGEAEPPAADAGARVVES